MRPILLSVLVSVLLWSPPGVAAGVRVYTSFEAAAYGWFDDTGWTQRGGYGRYPEDRKAAAAIMEDFKKAQAPLVPRAIGASWGWMIRGTAKGDTGSCTLAAAQLAINTWKSLAELGIVERPIGVEVECTWVTVTATFRSPEHPGPRKGYGAGCDVLHVVQVDKGSGSTTMEEAAVFGFPAAQLVPSSAEGPRGEALERVLMESFKWTTAARGIPTINFSHFNDAKASIAVTTGHCEAEPILSNDDLLCGLFVDVTDPRVCAGAGLLTFVRSLHDLHQYGVDTDQIPMTLTATCRSGHHARLKRSGGKSLYEFYDADGVTLLATGAPEFDTTLLEPRGRSMQTHYDDRRRQHSAPSAKTADARVAWYGRRMATVARVLGASKAELLALETTGLDAMVKTATLACDARSGTTPRACRAQAPEGTAPATCEAFAWALAAVAPHLPKPAFTVDEAVDLTVTCGPERQGLARRRVVSSTAPPATRLEIEVGSLSVGPEACEDVGFDIVCESNVKPASVPMRFFAPTDPAQLPVVAAPGVTKGPSPRGGASR